MSKITNMESDFQKKAEEKDETVKGEKQQLMQNLKEVEESVNEATELNKVFTALQKKNFDNKVAVYLKTKRFPEYSLSFENSAGTIERCKQQLFRGVQRLNRAIQSTKSNELKAK